MINVEEHLSVRTHLARATGLGATICLCVVLAASAQAPTAQLELPGYFRYSPAQLRAYQQSLRPRMNQLKQAAEKLSDFGNHQAWIAHREANGLAEIHETWTDFMLIVSGEASLVLGGEIDSPYAESPGEIRGSGVTGGALRVVHEGDVVNIPAGMQHRFLVKEGSQVTFFTMKIEKVR